MSDNGYKEKMKRFRQTVALSKKGFSERAIAKKVGVSRATVRHYLSQHRAGKTPSSTAGKRVGGKATQRSLDRLKRQAKKINAAEEREGRKNPKGRVYAYQRVNEDGTVKQGLYRK